MYSFENGELDLERAAQEHVIEVFTNAIRRYSGLMQRKDKHIVTESSRYSRNERYHKKRLAIRAFGMYVFDGQVSPGVIRPKARLFGEGAIS